MLELNSYQKLEDAFKAGNINQDLGGHGIPDSIGYFKYVWTAGFVSKKLLKDQNIKSRSPVTAWTTCTLCGNPIYMKLCEDENLITLRTDIKQDMSCSYPNAKSEEWYIELDCPSGEFILYNDLRHDTEGNDLFEESDKDISSLGGIREYSECYAKQGLGLIFVGNTSPRVKQESDSKLSIGYFGERKSKKVIGEICTDLWWYSIIDKDTFEEKFKMTVDKYQEWIEKSGDWTKLVIAKITPGRYRVSSRHHLVDENKPTQVYSTVELIPEKT